MNEIIPGKVPKYYLYNKEEGVIIMEYLNGYDNLKTGLIKEKTYSTFVDDITDFLSISLFETSDFKLDINEKLKSIEFFSKNIELV
jgi:5-methylthioribose kinase